MWPYLLAAGGGALGSWLARPKYRPQRYQQSPETSQVWQQLGQILSGNQLQRGIERSAGRTLGRSQAQGQRFLESRFGNDPSLLMSALQKLQESTAGGYAQASERGGLLQSQQNLSALGQMGNIASVQDQLRQLIERLNLGQRQRQEDYWQELLGGLLTLGGELGAARLGRSRPTSAAGG